MSLQTRLGDLVTALGTDYKVIRGLIGDLAGLTTADKTSLVAAVNEVKTTAGGGTVVQSDLDALKEEILGLGVPAALDTLDELAAALGDDANFASTVTASLGTKQSSASIGNADADLVALYVAAKA